MKTVLYIFTIRWQPLTSDDIYPAGLWGIKVFGVSGTMEKSFGSNQVILSFMDHSSDILPTRTGSHSQPSALPRQDSTGTGIATRGASKTALENKQVSGMDGLHPRHRKSQPKVHILPN